MTSISALGGVVLFASAGFFVLVMIGTLVAGKRSPAVETIGLERVF